jgi:hypothetical protein
MRQNERKSLILLEWDRWRKTQAGDKPKPTARDTLKFFYELQDRRSPLLDFRSGGRDKWQVVHDWLLSEGRVSEVGPLPRASRRQGQAAPAARRGKAS